MSRDQSPILDDYEALQGAVRELCANPASSLSALCNIAALLYTSLSGINWCGFYLMRNNELVLGPFQGNPACERISLGKGVCGTSALEATPLVVPNVFEFPGHIWCDAASQSEIVLPLIVSNEADEVSVLGVLDIDAPAPNRFDVSDLEGLDPIARTIASTLNWDNLL